MQERLESSAWGRVLISAVLVVILLTLLVANLPDSHLYNVLIKADHPVLYGVGLDQNWGVFAPDPRREALKLRALVQYEGGKEESWQVPTGDDFVGEYWDYRWLKWIEYVTDGRHRHDLFAPAAAWIARRHATHGRHPTQVTLIRRTYELEPPGHVRKHHAYLEEPYYTYSVAEHSGG